MRVSPVRQIMDFLRSYTIWGLCSFTAMMCYFPLILSNTGWVIILASIHLKSEKQWSKTVRIWNGHSWLFKATCITAEHLKLECIFNWWYLSVVFSWGYLEWWCVLQPMASSVDEVAYQTGWWIHCCHQVFSTLDLVVYEGPIVFPSGYIVFTC